MRRQALERAGRLLTEQLSAGTKALRIGPKLDRGTDVGPLISEAEARRVEEWVEEAKAAGATVHAGGKRHNAYYEPTVLAYVPSDAKVIAEEVFGPVVSILPFIEVRDAGSRPTTPSTASRPGSLPSPGVRHAVREMTESQEHHHQPWRVRISVGRGQLVDTPALTDALSSGSIAGGLQPA